MNHLLSLLCALSFTSTAFAKKEVIYLLESYRGSIPKCSEAPGPNDMDGFCEVSPGKFRQLVEGKKDKWKNVEIRFQDPSLIKCEYADHGSRCRTPEGKVIILEEVRMSHATGLDSKEKSVAKYIGHVVRDCDAELESSPVGKVFNFRQSKLVKKDLVDTKSEYLAKSETVEARVYHILVKSKKKDRLATGDGYDVTIETNPDGSVYAFAVKGKETMDCNAPNGMLPPMKPVTGAPAPPAADIAPGHSAEN